MREWNKEERTCKCGKKFITENYNQVHCSAKCRINKQNEYMARAVKHYKDCPLAKEERDAN